MKNSVINEAFDAVLSRFADDNNWQVLWPNVDEPDLTPPFLIPDLLVATPNQFGMQDDARMLRGIYQVRVITGSGSGVGDALAASEAIEQVFNDAFLPNDNSPGVVTADGVISLQFKAYSGTGFRGELGYTIPVSMQYTANGG
ncbi:tail terminator [Pectobacterium phage Ymer]|uniref:Tail terminator n=1 Tax=Pectobacterium phage Koroua TaxID=3158138 RepID=A0AB39ABJ9_9CAUD|nr:hypothetical protein Abuela_10 [Pectobacterium phage Abuela]WCD42775.1 hypothetical protein Ymer_6 [Pectobacterium phage Ymer]